MVFIYIVLFLLIISTIELIRQLFEAAELTRLQKEEIKPDVKEDVFLYSRHELNAIVKQVLANDRRHVWR